MELGTCFDVFVDEFPVLAGAVGGVVGGLFGRFGCGGGLFAVLGERIFGGEVELGVFLGGGGGISLPCSRSEHGEHGNAAAEDGESDEFFSVFLDEFGYVFAYGGHYEVSCYFYKVC